MAVLGEQTLQHTWQKLLEKSLEQALEPGVLYLLGTPIGHLGDLTPRAVAALVQAEVLACEDTRRTRTLLAALSLPSPQMIAYHQHNEQQASERLLTALQGGKRVVLVSDAGLPGISDPGQVICAKCHAAQIPVRVIPGPSAMALAAAGSGLIEHGFHFLGFLPVQGSARQAALARLRQVDEPQVFYEAPHRLLKTLQALAEAGLDQTPLVLAKELTKAHESLACRTVQAWLTHFQEDPERIRGEYVCVLDRPVLAQSEVNEEAQEAARWQAALKAFDEALLEGIGHKKAAKKVAAQWGLSSRELYQRALAEPRQAEAQGSN